MFSTDSRARWRVGVEQGVRRRRLHGDDRQAVRDDVVDLARDAQSLLVDPPQRLLFARALGVQGPLFDLGDVRAAAAGRVAEERGRGEQGERADHLGDPAHLRERDRENRQHERSDEQRDDRGVSSPGVRGERVDGDHRAEEGECRGKGASV